MKRLRRQVKSDPVKKFLSFYKLVLIPVTVVSVYDLYSTLNGLNCLYVVTGPSLAALPLMAVGRKVLNHRFTSYVLDLVFIAALVFLSLYSVNGVSDLDSGGCEKYYVEKVPGVNKSNIWEFKNKTELENQEKPVESKFLNSSENTDYSIK